MHPDTSFVAGNGNPILLALELAYAAYLRGAMPKEDLIETMRLAINATAIVNGYATEYGLPFPESRFAQAEEESP